MAVAPVPARSAAVVEEEEQEEKKRVRVTGTCTVLCDERVCWFFVFFHAGGNNAKRWGTWGRRRVSDAAPPNLQRLIFSYVIIRLTR